MTYSLRDWRAGVVPPKGWDCADAIDDGWTKADLNAFMREAMVDELPCAAEQMYPEDFPERPSPHPMLRVTDPKRWRNYPYGHFTRADRSKVLFDRDYCPIMSKSPTGHLEIVAPDMKIDFVEQQWLYRSYDSPRISVDTRRTFRRSADWPLPHDLRQLCPATHQRVTSGSSSLSSRTARYQGAARDVPHPLALKSLLALLFLEGRVPSVSRAHAHKSEWG